MQEKAIPEWRIVKEEILRSFYAAGDSLSYYQRGVEKGRHGLAYFLDFKRNVMATFFKTRMKIAKIKEKDRDGKRYREILKLDGHITDNSNGLTDKDWIRIFFLLGEFIEWIGISKIEIKEYDEDESMA